jgi:hypothetical protein
MNCKFKALSLGLGMLELISSKVYNYRWGVSFSSRKYVPMAMPCKMLAAMQSAQIAEYQRADPCEC